MKEKEKGRKWIITKYVSKIKAKIRASQRKTKPPKVNQTKSKTKQTDRNCTLCKQNLGITTISFDAIIISFGCLLCNV